MRITEEEYQRLLPGLKLPKPPRKKKNRTEENPVREAGKAWLEYHGCDVIRNNTGAGWLIPFQKGGLIAAANRIGWQKLLCMARWIRFGKEGASDLLAISPHGRWIDCEAKSEDGKQTPEQIVRKHEVERRGGVYVLFRSVEDLEARRSDILAPDW